jgi:hypothetical protein
MGTLEGPRARLILSHPIKLNQFCCYSVTMKLIAFVLLFSGVLAFADEYVPAHIRPDGSYVPPHYRASQIQQNNTTTYATVNPYTGAGLPVSERAAQLEGQARSQRTPVNQAPSQYQNRDEAGGGTINGVPIPPAHTHPVYGQNGQIIPIYPAVAADSAPVQKPQPQVSDHMTRVDPASPNFEYEPQH